MNDNDKALDINLTLKNNINNVDMLDQEDKSTEHDDGDNNMEEGKEQDKRNTEQITHHPCNSAIAPPARRKKRTVFWRNTCCLF